MAGAAPNLSQHRVLPPSRVRLINIPPRNPLAVATPGVISQMCDDTAWALVNELLAGTGLAELWLDNNTLVGEFNLVGAVRVYAARDLGDIPLLFSTSCTPCGPVSLCSHSAAAVLCAHGYTPAST